MVGRLSASLLHHADCKQWIARDIDSYISIAKNLSLQGPRSNNERMRLRKKLMLSALADGARLSAELERIYEELRENINLP